MGVKRRFSGVAGWSVRAILLARELARPPSREDRMGVKRRFSGVAGWSVGVILLARELARPPSREDRMGVKRRFSGVAGWSVRAILLARELARPPSREDGGKNRSPMLTWDKTRVARRPSRPPSRRAERRICPPFKGDGRVRNERCRGMTRSWTTNLHVRAPWWLANPAFLRHGDRGRPHI